MIGGRKTIATLLGGVGGAFLAPVFYALELGSLPYRLVFFHQFWAGLWLVSAMAYATRAGFEVSEGVGRLAGSATSFLLSYLALVVTWIILTKELTVFVFAAPVFSFPTPIWGALVAVALARRTRSVLPSPV